ncbi:VRR-NUC domain-containing protein [Spongiibacter nanhainus]|uniref:phosphodiesterase I n=1 Tax=Spongiibacter nanhainus TaxID=2794344 RepID=A0A7T4R0C5_9GAMM|nr:VRR-NUC domain-containing protein [Spongiibacter nanhainus]QQD17989.1 VRR-NUC domain-containing protein [Spongiibacter nanhainus]
MKHASLTAQTPQELNPDESISDRISAAPLSDPLYYLRNLHAVFNWVLEHHTDLLTKAEQRLLAAAMTPPAPAQALLARMIMRKGELFRSDKLIYVEVPELDSALADLQGIDWVDTEPALGLNQVASLCRRQELVALLQQQGRSTSPSQRKDQLAAQLEGCAPRQGEGPLQAWWPKAPFRAIRLQHSELIERVQLMFFGNLSQQWSEFVLTELGHQHYESVPFTPESRAFDHRRDIDTYLAIHRCRQRLDEGDAPSVVYDFVPQADDNPWLEQRRQRLLFNLAHSAERQGDIPFAITRYRENPLPDAQVRYCRLAEKHLDSAALINHINSTLSHIHQALPQLHLGRVRCRLARKLKLDIEPQSKTEVPQLLLSIPYRDDERVELATLRHLSNEEHLCGFYSENTLFTGLLALLIWPALYAPLPGAFFHPFQAGPADLFRPDFVERRQSMIDELLGTLESGEYRDRIRRCWQQKFGLSCPLVFWPALPEELLDLALALIPSQHLGAIFRHLLNDLRQHRSGMPDLILFDTQAGNYRLIEVKGPGDRLQDNQRLTIETLLEAGIPVQLANVDRLATP